MIRLLIRCLAVWRTTELVVTDELTRPLREWVGKRWPDSKVAYLVSCKACTSVWAAAVVLLAPEWMCTVLGLSGATMLLNDWRDDQASATLARRMSRGRVRREGETG